MLPKVFSRGTVKTQLASQAVRCSSSTRPRTVQLVMDLVNELDDSNKQKSGGSDVASVSITDPRLSRPDLERYRVVPKDPSFYMDNPPYEEVMRTLQNLIAKHINLPTVPQAEYAPQKWKAIWENSGKYRKREYRAYVALAQRLDMIDPQLTPRDVSQVLDHLRQHGGLGNTSVATGSGANNPRIKPLDHEGRASVVSRRKTSSARVITAEAQAQGQGTILVNGRPFAEYFPQLEHRQKITYPLKVTEQSGAFNIFATVAGGGVTGQADAVANGIGLALRMHNPLLATRLKKAGCIKPDNRQKERKKPGLAKARKAYTWVKR